jgi:hypothetical protein
MAWQRGANPDDAVSTRRLLRAATSSHHAQMTVRRCSRQNSRWSKYRKSSTARSPWGAPIRRICTIIGIVAAVIGMSSFVCAQSVSTPMHFGEWTIAFDGEARVRYEMLDEPGFGLGPRDTNGYVLQRYLFLSEVRFRRRIRLVAELQAFLDVTFSSTPRTELTLHSGR